MEWYGRCCQGARYVDCEHEAEVSVKCGTVQKGIVARLFCVFPCGCSVVCIERCWCWIDRSIDLSICKEQMSKAFIPLRTKNHPLTLLEVPPPSAAISLRLFMATLTASSLAEATTDSEQRLPSRMGDACWPSTLGPANLAWRTAWAVSSPSRAWIAPRILAFSSRRRAAACCIDSMKDFLRIRDFLACSRLRSLEAGAQ
jgi:hypothetical protein